jgi:S1-C subfamily serine protease
LWVAAFAAAACGRLSPDAGAAGSSAVDTSALAAQVLAEVEAQLAQDTGSIVPASAADQASLRDLEAELVGVYAQANPGVVYIEVTTPYGRRFARTVASSGSGFVYDEAGYIVTNNHVVAQASRIEVVFSDGSRQTAAVVGADAENDLAMLQVAELPAGVTALPLAAEDDLQVGQFVVAIGSPFGEQGSMSFGIVSGLERSLESAQAGAFASSGAALTGLIQTDAPINPGNSGGPLLNLDGEVVGITTAIESTTGTSSGVGFAIPAGTVIQLAPELVGEDD